MVTRLDRNVRRSYVDGRFGQIHLRQAGKESRHPPLLCLHLTPLSGLVYGSLLQEMGRDRLTLAPDNPGYGLSDPPPASPAMADLSGAMTDLMDELGLAEVDLIGYHTGSFIAVDLALALPRRVRKLVMISAPLFSDAEVSAFREKFARPLTLSQDGSHVAERWRSFLYWSMTGRPVEHVAAIFPDALRNPEISNWAYEAVFAYDLKAALGSLTQPVLVLNPEDDLHEQTRRAAGLIPNGTMLDLPGWNHGFLDLETAKVGRLLRDFLDDPEQDGA